MQYNTEFYKLLRQAVYDDTALVMVLDKIMKLINSNCTKLLSQWSFKSVYH